MKHHVHTWSNDLDECLWLKYTTKHQIT